MRKKSFGSEMLAQMIFWWPTFKIMCDTPFSINFKCQIESQVSDYTVGSWEPLVKNFTEYVKLLIAM
jgi:hypothetical protein